MVKVNFPDKFYVYAHKRNDNGEIFYIGKGHKNRAWKTRPENAWWTRIYKKHGRSVIIIKDGLTEDEAYLYEIELIKKYKDNGYNLINRSKGGIGGNKGNAAWNRRKVHCSNGMSFESAMGASKWVSENTKYKKASFTNITSVCLGYMYSSYGFSWWYDGDKPKEYVNKYKRLSLSKSKEICCSNGMVFRTRKELLYWLSVNVTRKPNCGNIYAAINGKARSAYGFSWWYKGDESRKYIPYNHKEDSVVRKKILRSDGVMFNSLREAADSVRPDRKEGTVVSNISSCALGKTKIAYGYTWKYIDEGN